MMDTIIVDIIKKVALASILGFGLGFERALRGKPASFRTFSIVASAACIFTILSFISLGDPGRIAAQVVSGVSFIGAGIVFRAGDHIEGVTTASMIWFAAAIGMACGFGQINLALVSFGLYIIIILAGRFLHQQVDKLKKNVATKE